MVISLDCWLLGFVACVVKSLLTKQTANRQMANFSKFKTLKWKNQNKPQEHEQKLSAPEQIWPDKRTVTLGGRLVGQTAKRKTTPSHTLNVLHRFWVKTHSALLPSIRHRRRLLLLLGRSYCLNSTSIGSTAFLAFQLLVLNNANQLDNAILYRRFP